MTEYEAPPVLEVEDLSVEFRIDGRWTPVVNDVSFAVGRGQTLAIVGESGSGKTVTSMALMRLLPERVSRIAGGRILFEGEDLTKRSNKGMNAMRGGVMSMIFQEPMTSLNPAFTVGAQIAEAVRLHRGLSRKQANAAAVEAMSSVGIAQAERRAGAYPYEFSGGMRQRVMIAMAVSCQPKLLIADEPTTALDVTIQAQILELLRELSTSVGMGMIFVTHDLGVVAEIADSVAVMYAGNIVENSPVHEIYARPRHPYTVGLLRSIPDAAHDRSMPIFSIPGAPPRPKDFPSGCRFHPRCEFATEACRTDAVPLQLVEVDHAVRCVRAEELELTEGKVSHV